MIQKIIKVGNSVAITLPHSFVREMNWQPGEQIFITTDTERESLTIHRKQNQLQEKHPITPEFVSWLDNFNRRHKKALTELADK